MTSTTANVTLELGRPEQSPIPNKSARKQAAQPTLALLAGFVLAICLAAAAFGYAASLSSRIDTLESQLATLQADDRADSQRMDAVLSPSVASPAGYGAPVSLLTGTGAWALGAPMPYERSDLQTIACNGTVVLLGGLDAAHAVVGDVVTFDPIHETYSTARAPMPTARYRFGAACLDHKIYVAGGFENATAGNNGWSLDTCDVYDVARDTWAASSSASSAACPRLGVARGDLALAALDGKLHAVGGYDWSYSEVATHETFDPTNPAAGWAAAAPMPNAKGDVQAAVVDGKMYVPGGWNSASTFQTELAVYDGASGTWELKAPMHAPRGDHAAVALHGHVIVVGGEMWSGQTTTCDWGWGPEDCAVNLIPMHAVEMYSIADDTWIELSPMPASRFRFAAAAVEGRGGSSPTEGAVLSSEGAVLTFGGHEHGEVAVASQWTFHYVEQRPMYVHTRDGSGQGTTQA